MLFSVIDTLKAEINALKTGTVEPPPIRSFAETVNTQKTSAAAPTPGEPTTNPLSSWTLSLSVKLKTMPPLSPTALVRDQIHPLSSETNSLAIMFMSLKLLTSLMYPLLMTLVHNIDHLHLWVTIPLLLPPPNPMFPLPSHDYLYVPLYVCLMHEA